MRICNPNQMVVALRKEFIGRYEVAFYILIQVIGLFSFFLIDPSRFINLSVYYEYVLLPWLITIISLVLAYRANISGDGKHFWYRYLCISFPVLFVTVVVSGILTLIRFFLVSQTPLLFNNIDVVIACALSVFYSLLIFVYLRKVSRP